MGKKEIWGKLQQMILEIAGDDTIVIEQDTKLIEDCGFDSLNIMDLLTEIENVFGVDFMDLENFEEKFNVCSQLCEGIEKLVAQKRGDCISE
ncbi:possible acyl carrier protein [Clostridium sp. CAG:230]|nr:acyl carrier protein [Lachnospiraceae bacterium]CDA85726.1 possible acyl carrier protein [Clostridium sp. CAG:230]